jgi:hypothetical protein
MPVFISHSQQDEALYSTLCLALEGAKISRWDVSSLKSGESLSDQLRIAIEQCELCIFLATKRSLESKWCLAELGAFWGAGKKVIIYLADPEITGNNLPPQFQGNLWAKSAMQLVNGVRSAHDQEYDVFIATPMAALETEEDYQRARLEVLKVCDAFRQHCGLSVYCAVEQCPTMRAFQTSKVSIKKDLKAIRKSHYFVMLYPTKILSSILVEAGFALATRKCSLYIAAKREEMPFMLQDAESAFSDVSLIELPITSNYDCIVDVIRNNGLDLFECG